MMTVNAKETRRLPSWIDGFLNFTDGLPTPEIFRQWGAINCIAGMLERRVWLSTAQGPVFPNLYTILVAPAGIGKSIIIDKIKEVWLEMRNLDGGRKLHVAPDDSTSASLVDDLSSAKTRLIHSAAEMQEYHSLLFAASELSVLLPEYDMKFLSKLLQFYDAQSHPFIETRRSRKEPLIIPAPQLSIIGGMTPSYLGHLLPEQAWGMGFTSRTILCFAGTSPEVDLFNYDPKGPGTNKKLWETLIHDARAISELRGELRWTPEAQDIVRTWQKNGKPPVPDHPKLISYVSRRTVHALKLIAVASVSRSSELLITPDDAVTGIAWLLEVEQHMPEIFKEMTATASGGAGAAINELHFFCLKEFNKTQKPLHIGRLITFLSTKVASYQIIQLIELAERSGLLRKNGPDLFTPVSRI